MRLAKLLVVVGALLLPVAYAGSVDFSASGSFADGSLLGGTVTIDTATGLALGADLTISGNPGHFTTLFIQRTWPPSSPFLSELIFQNGLPTANEIVLLFPPVSLIGYSGGLLCGAVTANCQDATLTYISNFNTNNGTSSTDFVALNSGALAATAPEPGTWLLTLSVGLICIARSRRAR